MKHWIGVTVTVAVLTAISIAFFESIELMPAQASAEALVVDDLFDLQMIFIAFLFALIVGFMVYSAFAFRRRDDTESDGLHIHGNNTVEVLWTVVPLVVVLWFAWHTAGLLGEITAAEPDELVVEVTGRQWSFEFFYPETGVSSGELVLPRDRQVRLDLTSTDVIHSFWVPEFRVKQDAVPGSVNPLRITPIELGDYKVMCAEICGGSGDLGHTTMINNVSVVEADAFETWMAEQLAIMNDPVTRGAMLAQSKACTACHNIDEAEPNPEVGPSWIGLFGREETLDDGTTVVVDEEYLRLSIIDPNRDIVTGFRPNVMPPTIGDTLTADEIAALIEFIKSLE